MQIHPLSVRRSKIQSGIRPSNWTTNESPLARPFTTIGKISAVRAGKPMGEGSP